MESKEEISKGISKIIYIAHPVGGNVKGNLTKIKHIVREVNLAMPGIIPFCPYWVDCHALNDTVSEERARGMRNNYEYFRRKIIDELWLDRKSVV